MRGGKKISWVKWDPVCQSKRNGGLGVRDVRLVNVSLLPKWRWRLLDGEKALWKDVLEEKYGPCVDTVLEEGGVVWPRFSSLWWKDLVKLDDFGEQNWFNSEIVKKWGMGLILIFGMISGGGIDISAFDILNFFQFQIKGRQKSGKLGC